MVSQSDFPAGARRPASRGPPRTHRGAASVARIAADWRIQVGTPFIPDATAWVAPARDDAGKDFVLKVGWPHPEAAHLPS